MSEIDFNERLSAEGLKLAQDQKPKEYILKPKRVLNAVAVSIALIVLLGLITFGMASSNWGYYDLYTILVTAGAVLLSIVIGILCGIASKVKKWTIGLDGLKIYENDKLKDTYPLSAYTGSNVIRNYTNGIYTYTTRSLDFINSKGRNTNLSWVFDAEKFSEAVEAISELKNYGGFLAKGMEAVDSNDLAADPSVNKIFELDRKQLKSKLMKVMFLKQIGFCILLIVVGVILAIWAGESGILGLAVLAGIALIFKIVHMIQARKGAKKIPGKFDFREDKVIIDGDVIKQDMIKKISSTPVQFSIGKLGCYWIKIRTLNAEKEYCLGRSLKNVKEGTVDYPFIVENFRKWAQRRGIEYNEDLS